MLDISNRHDARDDDFTFDAPASGSPSHFPQRLFSSDTVWDMVLAVLFVVITAAWVSQLTMWIVQVSKWAWDLF
jgi:hypothetical protein